VTGRVDEMTEWLGGSTAVLRCSGSDQRPAAIHNQEDVRRSFSKAALSMLRISQLASTLNQSVKLLLGDQLRRGAEKCGPRS